MKSLRLALLLALGLAITGACAPTHRTENSAQDTVSQAKNRNDTGEELPGQIPKQETVGAIEIGDSLEKLREWPQPLRSPGLRVDHPLDRAGFDTAPEVVRREFVADNVKSDIIAVSDRALYPAVVVGRDGRVMGIWVMALVDSVGNVAEVEVLGATQSSFAQEVGRAARRWRFQPARANGRGVPVWVTFVSGKRP